MSSVLGELVLLFILTYCAIASKNYYNCSTALGSSPFLVQYHQPATLTSLLQLLLFSVANDRTLVHCVLKIFCSLLGLKGMSAMSVQPSN